MEHFQTNIFEKTKEKSRKRLIFNLIVFGIIGVMWVLFFTGFPLVGIKTAIAFSIVVYSYKLFDDKEMGISAYGERKAILKIAEEYLEIEDVRIPYSEMTNLIIYVEDYLGKPNEFLGIHHGGNNKIEFERNGNSVSINYVIKNKQDYQRVSRLVDRIEKNPNLMANLRKL